MSHWDSHSDPVEFISKYCPNPLIKESSDEDDDYLSMLIRGDLTEIRSYLKRKGRLSALETKSVECKFPVTIKTQQQFIHKVLTENYFSKLFVHLTKYKEKEIFPCILFKNHIAWIAKDDDKGIYRYFTKAPDADGICQCFRILDMIQLAYEGGNNLEDICIHLSSLLGITCEEYEWQEEIRDWKEWQQRRQEMNRNSILSVKKEWKACYPALFKLAKTYLKLLLEVNDKEACHPLIWERSLDGLPIVYTSCRHLARKTGIDPSTVNKALNLFATLGLIRKIPPSRKDFPPSLLEIANGIQNSTIIKIRNQAKEKKEDKEEQKREPNSCPCVTFYSIPSYNEELLLRADGLATILIQSKITNIKKINQKNISKVFGKEFAVSIFTDDGKYNKKDSKKYGRVKEEEHSAVQEDDVDEEIPF